MKDTLGQPIAGRECDRRGSHHRARPRRRRRAGRLYDHRRQLVRVRRVAGAIYPVSWNPLNDFEPIARLPVSSLMIVGKTGLPANNAKELIAWLKANPGKATAASVGAGSGAHVCGLYFMDKTGTNFIFAQYRGGAPAMQDLVGNQIDLMCAEASQTLAARARRQDEGLRGDVEEPLEAVARRSDDGRRRRDRHEHRVLARSVGAEGHAQGGRRQAQCRGGQGVRRSGRAEADRSAWHDHPAEAEQTPKSLHDYHKAELDKWWPIIKAAGIKIN